MTACKGQAATGLLLGPTSKDFSLKRDGRICLVPRKRLLWDQLPGHGAGVTAWLGWDTAVGISTQECRAMGR